MVPWVTRVFIPNSIFISSAIFCTVHGRVSLFYNEPPLFLQIAPSLWDVRATIQYMVPHPSQRPKRHLNRFSHFCRAHERDQQTDTYTDHATLCVAIGRSHWMWCGLTVCFSGNMFTCWLCTPGDEREATSVRRTSWTFARSPQRQASYASRAHDHHSDHDRGLTSLSLLRRCYLPYQTLVSKRHQSWWNLQGITINPCWWPG